MRFIFNPATKNLETIDNVTGPDVTLGDKFKLAQLDNFNTPDLEFHHVLKRNLEIVLDQEY